MSAQRLYRFTPALDTVVNTATEYMYMTVSGSYETAAFQVVNTKISGTVAGTCLLEYSVDGTNYITVPSADTLTNTDIATNSLVWTLTKPEASYYRIKYTGSGTMSAQMKAYAHFKN